MNRRFFIQALGIALYGTIAMDSLAGMGSGLNILLITADDLGYEAVGCLNEGLPDLMPHLDRFACEGLSFMPQEQIDDRVAKQKQKKKNKSDAERAAARKARREVDGK